MITIDLVKIGKINKITELKKYPLEEPYFYNNYLFHYLIITNNLNALKMHKFPVQKLNEDGYNGYMLAAKYNYYDIIDYLIMEYPEYITIVNKINENFLHFLDPNIEYYYNFILDNFKKVKKLFYSYDSSDNCPLDYLFSMGSFDNIINLNKELNIEYKNYLKVPFYFNIFLNENLSSKDIIKIFQVLYKKDKLIFSHVDNEGNNVLFPIVVKNNLKLLKYMNELNNNNIINFDYYTPINTMHIFKIAYNKGIVSNDYEMAKYILDNIINNHDFNQTDKFGNNLVHYILKSRLTNDKGNEYIETKLLEKYDKWNEMNVKNETPKKLLRKIDKKYKHMKKYYKNIKKSNTKEFKGIELDKKKYSHSNQFQARFTDIYIFFNYLENKYDRIYIPVYKENFFLNSKKILYPDNLLYTFNNFPWIIVWNNKNNYFIHPKLNTLIKNNKDKYDFAPVLLSFRLPNGGLHATLILYDFKRNIIERFDPYGDTSILDKDLDVVLKKELTKNNKMKYYDTSCYFPVAGFQTLSNENNIYNQKMGDFGGFCLAWCLWYIEHRYNNNNINPKVLIRKTLDKINRMKLKPDEYIRNYANYINKFRINYLVGIGIPKNISSNEVLPDEYSEKLKQNIIKSHQ